MKWVRHPAVAVWLVLVVVCSIVISRAQFTADFSAFLPANPTQEQQVLVDQLRDGMVSRLVLLGIEGADADARARISKALAGQLRSSALFVTVNNGEPITQARDRALLFNHRYILSPGIDAERFTVPGLNKAIGESIELLASPAGLLMKPLLLRDPTGEFIQIVDQLNAGGRPVSSGGVWASLDGARALLLVQTAAAGSDTDGQQAAISAISAAYDEVRTKDGAASSSARLVMTGPGVFSVRSRATIHNEVVRLSTLGMAVIIVLLLIIYRSATTLVLGILPVISGVLMGISAVSLAFGSVHGITLGFGTTLIGEAVDYSIYLFVQSGHAHASNEIRFRDWVVSSWPTVRLGLFTSVIGFSTLLLSGFPGLAQLGLYSISGLATAAVVTRFVLPRVLPEQFQVRDVTRIGSLLSTLVQRGMALRWVVVALFVIACAVIFIERSTLWNSELSALSPLEYQDMALDTRLRNDLGAPDSRYVIVVRATDMEAALQSSESVSAQLRRLVNTGTLIGFESPSLYLPSLAAQRARRDVLPDAQALSQRLTVATADLPLRAERLTPFLADVVEARNGTLLQRADLVGSSFESALDALLLHDGSHWSALLPLRLPSVAAGVEFDPAPIRAALAAAGQSGALFIDLKHESDQLYAGYLREAISLSMAGLVAILALLFATLRSPMRVARVVAPLVVAVVVVVAVLVETGHHLTILHLVGMLLIVAVGSNYSLFFDRWSNIPTARLDSGHTLASLLFANVATVSGFGVLAFSSVSVLQALGSTVGLGAILALVFSAMLAGAPEVPLVNNNSPNH